MPNISGKVKITEPKASKGLEGLKYNISYNISNSEKEQRITSHSILTALKGNKRLLVDANSCLFNLQEAEREAYIMEFIKHVRSIGLEYRYRKIPNTASQGFIGKLFSMASKPNDAHQLFVLVPEEVWGKEDFISALPFYGLKYYIFKDNTDAEKVMENMYNGQILDFELYDYFSAIIFDCCSYGQMGIYTQSLSLDEVKMQLGL